MYVKWKLEFFFVLFFFSIFPWGEPGFLNAQYVHNPLDFRHYEGIDKLLVDLINILFNFRTD